MFLLWSPLPRQENVSFHENWRCIEAETCFVSFELLTKDQLTRVLPGDLLCGAEEEPLESLLEVLVEGDVDDRVDHGVGVGQHVDPEGVPGELVVGGEDGVGHQQLLWRPAEEEGCDHHEDQFENLLWKDQFENLLWKVAIGFHLIPALTFCKPFCFASFKLKYKFKIKLDWIKILAQTFGLNFLQTFFFARAWGVWTPVLSPGAEKKYLIVIVFI